MELERYQIKTSKNQKVYEFISIGIKGIITKRITYSKMTTPNLYNLALGDVDKITGKVNYDIVTNNGDRDKVLATVAASVYSFFLKYPNFSIHLTGNTDSRTRLYQMAISNNIDELSIDFHILGKLKGEILRFEKGINYEAFFIILKEKQ
jgi:hypothetical protein